MTRGVVILALALLLVACTPTQPAPVGAVDYCARNPGDELCQR